jgi:hypothetical protein
MAGGSGGLLGRGIRRARDATHEASPSPDVLRLDPTQRKGHEQQQEQQHR